MEVTVKLQARNATLTDLAKLLREQHAAKVDFVAPLKDATSHNGVIRVAGTSVFDDGQEFRPTDIADGHIAGKLGIPRDYLRKLRAERVDLFDANFNGWAQGGPAMAAGEPIFPPDGRTMLFRTFQGEPGGEGVLRAMLSERYGIIDNLDVLMAALDGVRQTGTEVDVVGCDLTETRMTVRIAAPGIEVQAPTLLKGYRNPFGGEGIYDHQGGAHRFVDRVPQWAMDKYHVGSNGVFGGFVITNSETGGHAFTLTPRIMILACLNGAMITADALRQVHLGGKLEKGIVKWSDETQRKSLDFITSQARDAVATFLDAEYVASVVNRIEEQAGTRIAEPSSVIEFIGKQLSFSDEHTQGILDHFIMGGQMTAGGVFQAVTSFAQTVESPNVAFDMEAQAMKALELAASK
jgi:hypothetical protein